MVAEGEIHELGTRGEPTPGKPGSVTGAHDGQPRPWGGDRLREVARTRADVLARQGPPYPRKPTTHHTRRRLGEVAIRGPRTLRRPPYASTPFRTRVYTPVPMQAGGGGARVRSHTSWALDPKSHSPACPGLPHPNVGVLWGGMRRSGNVGLVRLQRSAPEGWWLISSGTPPA